jgi:hypothetical protein
MTFKTFTIVYYPFLSSDATSTGYWTGKDEADCIKSFLAAHPMWVVKSVEEKEIP